jgi:hypothetical protein
MQNHAGSSARSIDKKIKQLSKGAQQIAYNIVLIQKKINRLQEAIEALTKRKARKRRYVRVEETLTVREVSDLITKQAGSSYEDDKTPTKRVRAGRRCSTYSKTRHNSRIYKVEIEDTEDSDESE